MSNKLGEKNKNIITKKRKIYTTTVFFNYIGDKNIELVFKIHLKKMNNITTKGISSEYINYIRFLPKKMYIHIWGGVRESSPVYGGCLQCNADIVPTM